MDATDGEQQDDGQGQRAQRRETMLAIGAGGLALLAGLGLSGADRADAKKKRRTVRQRRRKRQDERGGRNGVGDLLSFQKAEGTSFTVADGQSADGFAGCPNSGIAISGGFTQTNTKCYLAQSDRDKDARWSLTVTCRAGDGGTEVTPFVICAS